MTELIYGWMKNLAYFFIFMTAVLNCLPDNRYRKYVRFFLGMLLIIILCKPLTEFLKLDQILETSVSRGLLDVEVEGMEDRMKLEGQQEQYLIQGYEAEVADQVRRFLLERGVTPVETSVTLRAEDMSVERIHLTVAFDLEEILYQSEVEDRRKELESRIEEIKKELSEVYQMEVEHIDAAIQE